MLKTHHDDGQDPMSYADATAGKKRDASKKRAASTALDKAAEEEALAKKHNASSALDEAMTDDEALAAGQRLPTPSAKY